MLFDLKPIRNFRISYMAKFKYEELMWPTYTIAGCMEGLMGKYDKDEDYEITKKRVTGFIVDIYENSEYSNIFPISLELRKSVLPNKTYNRKKPSHKLLLDAEHYRKLGIMAWYILSYCEIEDIADYIKDKLINLYKIMRVNVEPLLEEFQKFITEVKHQINRHYIARDMAYYLFRFKLRS